MLLCESVDTSKLAASHARPSDAGERWVHHGGESTDKKPSCDQIWIIDQMDTISLAISEKVCLVECQAPQD